MADDELTIATLPPDIIRRIIRLQPAPIRTLRQISQSWNKQVIDYVHQRSYLPVFDRVLIQVDRKDLNKIKIGSRLQLQSIGQMSHMPRQWQSRGESTTGALRGSLLVSVPPPSMSSLTDVVLLIVLLQMASFIVLDEHSLVIYSTLIFFLTLSLLPTAEQCEVKRSHQLLKRNFSKCASITTMRLEDIKSVEVDAIRRSMEEMTIEHCTIDVRVCDTELRTTLLQLVKKCEVGRLAVFVDRVQDEQGDLRDFLLTVSQHVGSGFELTEVLDKSLTMADGFFQQGAEEWKQLGKELATRGGAEVKFSSTTCSKRRCECRGDPFPRAKKPSP